MLTVIVSHTLRVTLCNDDNVVQGDSVEAICFSLTQIPTVTTGVARGGTRGHASPPPPPVDRRVKKRKKRVICLSQYAYILPLPYAITFNVQKCHFDTRIFTNVPTLPPFRVLAPPVEKSWLRQCLLQLSSSNYFIRLLITYAMKRFTTYQTRSCGMYIYDF